MTNAKPLPFARITMARIDQAVTGAVGSTRDKSCESKRARNIAMYLARQLTRHSLNRIAEEYELHHHTTVLAAIRQVAAQRRDSPEFDRILTELKARIENSEASGPTVDLSKIKLDELAETIAEKVIRKLQLSRSVGA